VVKLLNFDIQKMVGDDDSDIDDLDMSDLDMRPRRRIPPMTKDGAKAILEAFAR
jgi:hypothetical protein